MFINPLKIASVGARRANQFHDGPFASATSLSTRVVPRRLLPPADADPSGETAAAHYRAGGMKTTDQSVSQR
jgi:hypothetical protein